MFRLVYYADAEPGQDDLGNFLSREASDTIIKAIDEAFSTMEGEAGLQLDPDQFEAWYKGYFQDDFFEGLGAYLGVTDGEAGREIIGRKILRMREKLADPKEFVTFDILEERIFSKLIWDQQIMVDSFKFWHTKEEFKDFLKETFDIQKEKEARRYMVERFDLSQRTAKQYAKQIYRLYKMGLDPDESDNLFFWDDDYDSFWQNGFLEGMQMTRSTWGEMRGYGYAYACEMFEDIGIAPPLRLLGSEEANRLINEKTRETYLARMDEFLKFIQKPKKEIEDALKDPDFSPFNLEHYNARKKGGEDPEEDDEE